jgi:glyoxylase-like metal-dependent hydrolase (beta-lactamase superfamily II)
METAPAFETLRAAMVERQIEWREIHQIVLTHMHPDHMGMAARLLKLTGAQLAMHHAEAEHLRSVTGGDRRLPWLQEAYTQSGVPQSLEQRWRSISPRSAKIFIRSIPLECSPAGSNWKLRWARWKCF